MRVIAGELRGRKLTTVKDLSVRPTTDRAKQVIFDVLATRVELDGAGVLDLFAGSGSLGIEAISRGASSVVFVERSAEALSVLRQNLEALGIESDCEIIRDDVLRYVVRAGRQFDVVFADPPYDLDGIERLPDTLALSGVVREGGWLVMEHRSSSHVAPDPALFSTVRKELGQTIALILRYGTGRAGEKEERT